MSANYTPKPRPKATDLAAYATIYDAASFTPAIRARWCKAAKHAVASYLAEIGVMRAVEVAGDLRVRGNFDTAAHGIAALYVHGDLVVDGVYTDPSSPQTVVLVGGALRAKTIVTGAHLEVRGKVTARHLAGYDNDYTATFFSGVEAATFFPEYHHFALAKKPTFQLVIGESAPHRVPAAIRTSLKPPPDGGLDAFLARGLISGGELGSPGAHDSATRKSRTTQAPDTQCVSLALLWLPKAFKSRTVSVTGNLLKALAPRPNKASPRPVRCDQYRILLDAELGLTRASLARRLDVSRAEEVRHRALVQLDVETLSDTLEGRTRKISNAR